MGEVTRRPHEGPLQPRRGLSARGLSQKPGRRPAAHATGAGGRSHLGRGRRRNGERGLGWAAPGLPGVQACSPGSGCTGGPGSSRGGGWGQRSGPFPQPAQSEGPRRRSERRRGRPAGTWTQDGAADSAGPAAPAKGTGAGPGHPLAASKRHPRREPQTPDWQRPSRAHAPGACRPRGSGQGPGRRLRANGRGSRLPPPSEGEGGRQPARSTGGSRDPRVSSGATRPAPGRGPWTLCPSGPPEAGAASLATAWRLPRTGHQAMAEGGTGLRPRRQGACSPAVAPPAGPDRRLRAPSRSPAVSLRRAGWRWAGPCPAGSALLRPGARSLSSRRCGCLPGPRRPPRAPGRRGAPMLLAPPCCPPRAAAGPAPLGTGPGSARGRGGHRRAPPRPGGRLRGPRGAQDPALPLPDPRGRSRPGAGPAGPPPRPSPRPGSRPSCGR